MLRKICLSTNKSFEFVEKGLYTQAYIKNRKFDRGCGYIPTNLIGKKVEILKKETTLRGITYYKYKHDNSYDITSELFLDFCFSYDVE